MINNIKTIVIIALIAVILFMQFCGGEGESPDIVMQHNELLKKVALDSAKRRDDSLKNVIHFSIVKTEREFYKEKAVKTEIKVYQQQGTINRLVTQLQAAKVQPFDSSFVFVSPDYVEACDSLGDAAVQQGELLKQAKNENEKVYELLNYEVYIRDSVIDEEAKKLNELRADFNAQTHFFQLAIKQGKPRTKVFIGGETFFNDKIPVSGAGVTLDLLTKKNKQIGVGGGFQTLRYELPGGEKKTVTDWYGKVSYKFLISFKK